MARPILATALLIVPLLEKGCDVVVRLDGRTKPQDDATSGRRLKEGMALGFVMGPYPERSDGLANMNDQAFQ